MSSEAELFERASASLWSLHRASHPSEIPGGLDRDGFYVGMLVNDLEQKRYAYEVSIVPKGVSVDVAKEALFALLDDFVRQGYGDEPFALISAFADRLLQESMNGTGMMLELHGLSDEYLNTHSSWRRSRQGGHRSLDKLTPSLGYIPSWTVVGSRTDLRQVATAGDMHRIVIPQTRVQKIKMRATNEASWQKTIKQLRKVDKVKDADYWRKSSWRGYDFSEQRRTQSLAVAATTAPIGWDGRGTFIESVTSPYLMYRRLCFVRFWVELLEDSVAFLNRFTGSESLRGEAAFTFTLEGLPSSPELTSAMRDIRSGSLSVAEAQRTYLFPRR